MLINPEAIGICSIDDLSKNHIGDILKYSRVCINADLPNVVLSPKAIAILKNITGNDSTSLNPKYKRMEGKKCLCKMVFSSNYKLRVQEPDTGLEKRLIVIPFMNVVPKETVDTELLDKLKMERDAIFTKALHAYYTLRNNNYVFEPILPEYDSESMIECTYSDGKGWYNYNNGVSEFLEECCVLRADLKIYSENLFMAYKMFCSEKGYDALKSSAKLSEKIYRITRIEQSRFRIGDNNKRGFVGIGLKPEISQALQS